MDSLAALERMTEKLLTQFDPPKDGWAKMAVEMLSDLSPDALDAAAVSILKTRKYPSFPSIAEIREAAQAWMAAKRAETIRQTPKAVDGEERSSEREQRAYTALKTDLGKRAADEGWAAGLWQYVHNHGRMPDAIEQSAIKREQEAQRRSAEQFPQFGLGKMHAGMERQYAKAAQGE